MKDKSPTKESLFSDLSSNKNKNRNDSFEKSRSRSISPDKQVRIKENFSEKSNISTNINNIFEESKEDNKDKNFVIKNGCCRDCMKAFSKSGKSCLCQVPKHERKYTLADKGCNFCGCKGCNPLDIRKDKRKELKRALQNDKDILFKRQRILDSDDEEILTNLKDSDDYNKYRNDLEKLIGVYFKNFGYVGYGAPTRSSTYILGYNPKITDIVAEDDKTPNKDRGRKYRNEKNNRGVRDRRDGDRKDKQYGNDSHDNK